MRLLEEAFTKPFVRSHEPMYRDMSRRAKNEHPIWQHRFWEHVIRDEAGYPVHIDYIHYNPVRYGFAKAVRDWPYSGFSAWVERGV